MKKLILFILSLTPFLGYADEGFQRAGALETANDFLRKIGHFEKNNLIEVKLENLNIENVNTSLHVFSDQANGGFLIVSETADHQFGVLGYSETGLSSDVSMPPQLKEILKNYSKSEKMQLSESVKRGARNRSVLLNTAQWGQGYPYNTQCPIIDGDNAPTGCVATAMAIMMKYHNWPNEYSWERIPSESIQTENPQLSYLMAEIGGKVSMNYSPLNSEAYAGLISQVMFADFGFSHQAQLVTIGEGNHVKPDDWERHVIEELDNERPVIYIGTGTDTHAFIVDGYDTDGLFHINWGWDGAYNGYFDLNQLVPYEGAYFSNSQGMVMSLMPGNELDLQYSTTAYMDYGYLIGLECMHGFGVNPNVTTIEKNVPFNVTYGTLNVKPGTWFGVALTDEKNIIKEVLYSELCPAGIEPDDSGYIHYAGDNLLTVTSDISDTDKIQIIAKDKETSPWLLVRGTSETPSYQNVNNIKSSITTFNWVVPDEVEIKCRVGGSDFSGTLDHVAKGSLLEVCSYSKNPGQIIVSLNGQDRASQDISLWEYGKIGATNSIFCVDDIVNVNVKFIPENEYDIVNIELSQPGTLEQALNGKDLTKIVSLAIKGKMDNRDFVYIRNNLSKIISLDISGVSIEAYDKYEINHLPEEALAYLNRLKHLELPEIEVIETRALYGLNSLYELTIPKSVDEIGDYALYECNNLKRIVFKNETPFKGSSNVFPSNISYYAFIVVPDGSRQAYLSAEYAKMFGRILEGELVPATSIKIVNSDYQTAEPIPVAFGQSPTFDIILEPENSTDYILSAIPDENRFLDIQYAKDTPSLHLSHFVKEEKEEEFFVETSSGASSKYVLRTIPPIKTFKLQKEIEMKEKECLKLDYELYPSSYDLFFNTMDPQIASVSREGEVTALKAGETIITATATDAIREYTAQCKVRVSDSTTSNVKILSNDAHIKIYNINGLCIGSFSSLEGIRIAPGFYIIEQGGVVRKTYIGNSK